MIKHIVLLEFAANLPTEQSDAILTELGQLAQVISPMKNYSFGKNNSPEGLNASFNYGFIMEFDSIDARNVYLEHPLHVKYKKKKILPNLNAGINSVLVFDY